MKRKLHLLPVVAVVTVLLTACGGFFGDDDNGEPAADPTLVPSSATASTTAWVNFAKGLMNSDTSEALSLTNVTTLPTSETEEGLSITP